MPADRNDLQARLVLTKPSDTVRGFIFSAVLKLVESHLGKGVSDKLRQHVAKGMIIDFLAYPATAFLKVLYDAVDLLEPVYGSPEAALRACGASTVSGFFDSAVGQTLLKLVSTRDPRKAFSQLPTAYSTLVSYGQRFTTVLGDKKVKITFKDDMQPFQFHEGALAAALKSIHLKGTVKGTAITRNYSEYLLEWI